MNHLSTNERIIELLFTITEANSQGGFADGQEVTAHVFILSHLVIARCRVTAVASSMWQDREGKIGMKSS